MHQTKGIAMTQIKIKREFKTQKRKTDTRKIISLHVSAQLNEIIGQAAHKNDVTKQDLIRQMIRHCLKDLNFSIPEDTDTTPPKKRTYGHKTKPKKLTHST